MFGVLDTIMITLNQAHLRKGFSTISSVQNWWIYPLVGIFYLTRQDNILKISFPTAFAMSPCLTMSAPSMIDPTPRSLAILFTSIPLSPCNNSTDPTATRQRTIGSDSYLPHVTIFLTTSMMETADTDDGEADAWIYELVLRIVVATESRTFLLFDSAHALAHSKILFYRYVGRVRQATTTSEKGMPKNKQ